MRVIIPLPSYKKETNLLQKRVGFALSVIAIGLFVPGILAPMFSLNMELAVFLSGPTISSELINKELSVVGTVQELLHEDRVLVAILIFAFSVIIPLIKTSLITSVYFTHNIEYQHRISKFVAAIGKWSMADVFVVAIFLAVLSTNHAQSAEAHELSFLGITLDFEVSTQTMSNVGVGFYYFVAYCLVSLLGSQLMLSAINNEINLVKNTHLRNNVDKTPENAVKSIEKE
ncbi:MAG: paraquat-inducible protein A [Glaciecola sp.]|jgi:paraquat-inducible protein A